MFQSKAEAERELKAARHVYESLNSKGMDCWKILWGPLKYDDHR